MVESANVSILMVDDRQENLLALEAALSCKEYRLISFTSGEEALRYILKENIEDLAVILLDVQMQGMDGFETAKFIKSRNNAKEIPIIFITANSKSMDEVLKGYHVGSVDYIFKPFHPEMLRSKVQAFVTMHRYHKRMELMVQERTRELIEANERLRKSQDRFKKLFVSNPCLMAIWQISDMKYIDVNDSWLQATGYTKEQVIGSNVDLLQMSSESSELDYTRLTAGCRNLQIRYRTQSGQIRDGLLSLEPIEIDGALCELSLIVDVTDKKKWEKEMLRLDQLNLVGEMAAGIAHEIRNPMTTIQGFLQISKNSNSFNTEYVDLMLEELNRANSIIKEYLSLAKNKSTDLQRHSLHTIIDSILPLIQADALLASKRIESDIAVCPPLLIDEKEIRQLILNLAINGLEAMQAGGVLTIATYCEGADVLLEIRDQGHGIAPEYLDKIGTPFFTTKETGTGLGLAVCYSIASRHQATIKVQSSETGTIFTVKFRSIEMDGEG